MGLRKLTQWEETVAKQEQKQSRLMSVAIVCVIAMCAVLWLVQDKLYGDVVQTGTATYLGAFTGAGIGRALRSIKEKESAEKQKRNGKEFVDMIQNVLYNNILYQNGYTRPNHKVL